MSTKEREAMEQANRLAQDLLDRDWRDLGVSQEELDRSRLLEQRFNAELDAGCNTEEILRRWDDKSPES